MGLFKRIGNEIDLFAGAALRTLSRVAISTSAPMRPFRDVIEGFARSKPNNIAIYFEDRK